MPGIADIRKLTDLLNGHRSFGSQSFRILPLHSTISNEDQGSVFNVPPKGVRKITLLALRLLRDQLSKLINSSYRNPGREWTQDQRNYFDLATQVLGMGANDKDKVMQT
ncbi:p-loop containing nucleoside triphosphate hydrolase protein [Ceraceosorus bombacis]|uniref:p-loop containing nucleoside triphosphate hydrolase protein n=1 Tax=Ceraceosorus bombacis TaxID=401625 RepID=A0A0N7LAF6_9BASI|nr:p-loop containing nucleoside triphosphate hydrolase protein [Ceraceosorus bombacis]